MTIDSGYDYHDRAVEKELTFDEGVRLGHKMMLLFSAAGGMGILALVTLWPQIFAYPYTRYLAFHPSTFVSDVLRFWPAFAWCLFINFFPVVRSPGHRARYDEILFVSGATTSISAGLAEELWFRVIAPFYYIYAITGVNWLMVHAPLLVFAVIGILIWFATKTANHPNRAAVAHVMPNLILLTIACTLAAAAMAVFPGNPMFGISERFFYPVITWVSTLGGLSHLWGFYGMEPVFTGGHDPNIVLGLVFAKFAFRDGHKYQGPVGWTNAWWMGCVFLYATLLYGIWVAMMVHALFDLTVNAMEYIGLKMKPEPASSRDRIMFIVRRRR